MEWNTDNNLIDKYSRGYNLSMNFVRNSLTYTKTNIIWVYMKKSRMNKRHKNFYSAITDKGYKVLDEVIIKQSQIHEKPYDIAVKHVPKSTNLSKEINALESKLNSKQTEMTNLLTDFIHRYDNVSVEEIFDIVKNIDGHGKKISKIRTNSVSELEKESIRIQLSDIENVRDYPDVFPRARKRKRKIVAHLGETNSGKTYQAFKELTKHTNTAYLAPLRLLALENYDYLNSIGYPTSLITGEERQIKEESLCTSSTVECFNFNNEYDTIIIDEIQMIDDRDRGWAFTQALVGANADTIIVTGPEEYEDRLKSLADYLGDEIEVKIFNRKTQLKVENKITKLRDVQKNTAIVVFSRRDIYKVREALPKKFKASLIYGALGSDVRKLQAQRYIDGESDILITTDAVGMGLNLPIEKILFTTHTKFDGIQVGPLGEMLTKQISGRAGRYGIFDNGFVGATTFDSLKYIQSCMKATMDIPDGKLQAQPTEDYINALLGTYNLSTILSDWSENNRFPDSSMFTNADMTNKILIAKMLEKTYPDKVGVYHKVVNCPIDYEKDATVLKHFLGMLIDDKNLATPKCNPSMLSVSDLEFKVKEMLIFRWFLNQYPDYCVDFDEEYKSSLEMLDDINQCLNKKLIR